MLSLLSSLRNSGGYSSKFALTAALILLAFFSTVGTSTRHALTTAAFAWLCIAIVVSLKTNASSLVAGSPAQIPAWTAGGLLALASICERSVIRKDLWWAKAPLPAIVFLVQRTATQNSQSPHHQPQSPSLQPKHSNGTSNTWRLLALSTVSAWLALQGGAGASATLALGCCEALLLAEAFRFIEHVTIEASDTDHTDHTNGNGKFVAGNGFLSPLPSSHAPTQHSLAVLRDVAVAATVALWVAAFTLEDLSFFRFRHPEPFTANGEQSATLFLAVIMVLVHMALNATLVFAVPIRGQLPVAFILLASALLAQLTTTPSLSSAWFTIICAFCMVFVLDETSSTGYFAAADDSRKMKAKRLVFLAGSASITGLALINLHNHLFTHHVPASTIVPALLPGGPPSKTFGPLAFPDPTVHPVDKLVRDAEAEFMSLTQRQSRTLEDAVEEYRRRYQIPPPPNFDKWFAFAKKRGVQLIDEYDTIYHSLLPFWALKPATIRARVREAIGFDGNNLIALLVRQGQVAHVHAGQEWQQKATIGMMKQFIDFLPDMDLAFNMHDEPRVVVPHDELSQLIARAKNENMPLAAANPKPRNKFSPKPKDVNNGGRVDEVKTTRFNVFAHQQTWIPSRLSCSPDSPARALDDDAAHDNLTAYALGDLGFIYNHTAFSDVCNSPSFAQSHGFFDRPNAFNVVHDLFPIFSQSKMSSFQDILYPSPWYWYGKVSYDEEKDLDWIQKENKLWWVGSTTGGFSRDGGWRRQHRQQVVQKLNALDSAKILHNTNLNAGSKPDSLAPNWQKKDVARQDFSDLMDVHFSGVGQCDPGDCDAQREFFQLVPPADQQDAWKYKYLLDLDGNAFSGRFYAFLKSKSLVFKMAVFREWHEEWLKPWVHYIPLSLRGEESLESVRYFSGEAEGKVQAVRLAEQGRQWANKVLRNEDFEVWFFRLLLEYARVIDDDRESIGYSVT